jgi:hypothetical protein
MEEYRVPLITMSYCKNTELNGEWCKSKEEIEAFLEKTSSFFVHMHTYVQQDVWQDDPVNDDFPYNGDGNKTFPTTSTYVSSRYGTISVNAANRNETFLLDEFNVEYNSFRIYDDPLEI